MLATYEKMGKKMIQTITGFNQTYYDLIGRDSVNSWLANWPEDMKITCYVEEFCMPENDRVVQIDFSNLDPDYFLLQQEEGYHSSVKKFAKKAYAIIHAMYHSTADWILWVDADVVTLSTIPENFWKTTLNNHYLAAFMGVTYLADKIGNPGNWLVPETGVFAVNTKHPGFNAFRSEYRRRYVDRDFKDLRRFYDNDVLGAAINAVPAEYLDWCANFSKPYKTPIKHTVLGPYLHHYKAKHSKASYAESQ